MSSFTGEIILKKIGSRIWEVYTPFEYHIGSEDSNDIITIPKGMSTDFASVPRLLWAILPPDGQYTAATIVHDFLYFMNGIKIAIQSGSRMIYIKEKYPFLLGYKIKDFKFRKRSECDRIFLEAMQVLEVPWWKRKVMYAAVRAGGWIPWNNYSYKQEKQKEKS